MWGKRPLIPKSVEVQEKYRHEHVLAKLEDEQMHAKLSLTIAIFFSVMVLLLGVLFLHYALHLFSQKAPLIMLGLGVIAVLATLAWFMGIKIAHKAKAMRIARYYQLYTEYSQQLEIVQEARERLMRAESDLAKRERELDHLIEQSAKQSLFIVGLSAVSTVVFQRHTYSQASPSVDVTDQVVHRYEEYAKGSKNTSHQTNQKEDEEE